MSLSCIRARLKYRAACFWRAKLRISDAGISHIKSPESSSKTLCTSVVTYCLFLQRAGCGPARKEEKGKAEKRGPAGGARERWHGLPHCRGLGGRGKQRPPRQHCECHCPAACWEQKLTAAGQQSEGFLHLSPFFFTSLLSLSLSLSLYLSLSLNMLSFPLCAETTLRASGEAQEVQRGPGFQGCGWRRGNHRCVGRRPHGSPVCLHAGLASRGKCDVSPVPSLSCALLLSDHVVVTLRHENTLTHQLIHTHLQTHTFALTHTHTHQLMHTICTHTNRQTHMYSNPYTCQLSQPVCFSASLSHLRSRLKMRLTSLRKSCLCELSRRR